MKKPMMRHRSLLSLAATLLMVLFMAASCEKPEEICTCETQENVNLRGTQWKLEGIVNVQTGEMQVLEPVDCEGCYTLVFATDTTGIVNITSNMFWFELKPSRLSLGVMFLDDEIGDGYSFIDVLTLVSHYEHDSDNAKLKFFYQREDIDYYLIFKIL